MSRTLRILFVGAIILGFFIRLRSLFFYGMFDMGTYYDWGLASLVNGLHKSYNGIYFPIQYQIFEFCTWISFKLNIDYFIAFKSVNLLFDCGNLIVLYMILRKMGVSVFYLLIYWLHPWFLNMFSLGYIDFQFTFFVLLSLYFTFRPSDKSYLLSGLFLGIAFLMKPQAQILVLAYFIYCSLKYLKDKDFKPFLIFVLPVFLFIVYSLYFSITAGSPLRLADTYLFASNHMPCLNANFLNGWFSIAYLLKDTGAPIYSISDQITIFHIQIKLFAILGVLLLIIYFIKRVLNSFSGNSESLNFFLIACFSSLVVPFVMTSAHENHLFLGTVLLIPVLGKAKSLIAKISIHLLLILQLFNLYGYYGIGETTILRLKNFSYSYEIAFILSIIAFFAFLIILFYFLNPKTNFTLQIKTISLPARENK